MTGSRDFLSSCPFLLDVLRFCKHNDILNCKLTSRRLYEVIHRNPFSVPRRRLLRVLVKTWKEETKEYVRISIDHQLLMFVTKGQITLMRCERSLKSPRACQILQDVVPTKYKSSNKDVVEGLLELVQTDFAYTDTESYENGTIAEGLHKIFSFLLQHCSICSLRLQNNMKEDWLNGISMAFCDNRSRCNKIGAVEIAPGLQQLVASSGCKELGLASSRWKDGFLHNVVTMSSWNSHCRYKRSLTEHDSIEAELLPILQIWESAKKADEISLNRLQLTAPPIYRRRRNSPEFNQQAVDDVLEQLKNCTVYKKYYESYGDKRVWKTTIGRPLDRQIITLTLKQNPSDKRNTLLVEEGPYSQLLKDN